MMKTGKSFLSKGWRWGQSVLEYAILLGIVSAAFVTMTMYVRRAVQGSLYQIEDRITAKTQSAPVATVYVPPI